jgi:hypothetical protein
MSGTIKDFFKLYFHVDFFKNAWRNGLSFFCQDDDEAEIEALEETIKYLEKRKGVINTQLTICRWELTRKKQLKKLVD